MTNGDERFAVVSLFISPKGIHFNLLQLEIDRAEPLHYISIALRVATLFLNLTRVPQENS